ncbi:hypothetical protein F5J12DRAFT_888576 [Pisolithus orientalis]|uniref:uncharacterized protein n=1 Tax=Pisolithus orientalis TaxID=936130 RepID=UPI0022241C9B|nr:uncharacterized protein F5J12DRAFT_888576 [Pisolithus orientalis]KAI6030768.1 hypothetical protein F5J12DRAFT_888576 [Pisolithus orientalis]
MSSHQASPHVPNNPSGFQRATMPELQTTSDGKEVNIWVKMAKHKWCKALREEAAWLELEAKRHEQEWLEAKRHEQEQLEAKRWEQEQLEAKCQEQETHAQQMVGELKGAGTVYLQSHAAECEFPEGVEPKIEEVGAKAGKKRVPEDAMLPRAGEKMKVIQTRSGVPSELEAGPSGVGVPSATPTDPLVAAVNRGFELIAVAMDCQTTEMQARRETQHWFNSWLGDLLGEFEFVLCPTPPASESSEELHLDVADLELESLQSDQEGVGVELDKGIMCWPKDMHMKGQWSSLESGEE